MAFPLGCLKLESNCLHEVILFFPLSLSHDRVSFLLSILQNDLFLQSISLCGCSVTSSPFSHCRTRRLKPKFPLGVDKALMHTPVCLCSISDHVPQSQSHRESLWARGWEVCKYTSFLLLLQCVCVSVWVGVSVSAHPRVHSCMLICPLCFSHSIQLCSMAQSCLGEQTA